MSNIRVARVEDYQAVREMATKFYGLTSQSRVVPWDEESAQMLYCDMIANGFLLLAQEGDKYLGMIGCMVTPALLNKNHKIATEIFWWVEPDYRRGRTGIKLVQAAETLARLDECSLLVMSQLDSSPDGVEKVLQRMGFEWQEKSFVKEL